MMRRRLFVAAILAVLLNANVPVAAQITGAALSGSFDGYDFLLLNDGVQKELKLGDDQVLKAKEIIHDVRRKYRSEMEQLQKLPAPHGSARLVEAMEKISAESLEKLADTLKPDQIKRLRQVKVQNDEMRAFTKSDVAVALRLTQAQKEQIKIVHDELGRQSQRAFQAGTRGGFQEALAKLRSLRREAVRKVVLLLGPEQKKVWQDLTGEPFELKDVSPTFRRTRGREKQPDR
jgi:hypothetical protein